MAADRYDAIVIGAGHNGLVGANYLAKAGRKVLVLERRDIAGGQLVTESFGDGFVADSLHASGRLRPDIVRDLGLGGPAFADAAGPAYTSLLGDGTKLELYTTAGTPNVESIRRHSARDAGRWPEFVAFMDRAAAFLDAAYGTPMPRLPHFSFGEGLPLAKLLWKLRRLGGRDMFRVVRAMSMSVEEFTDNWFESEEVRAAVSALAIHGVTLGAMSAGTGYTLMHNWLNRGGLAHRPVAGGVGRITDALVAALKARGGEVRTASGVQQILVDKQRATGVRLASGEEISASVVFSAADPRHTLLTLVGCGTAARVRVADASIKMRGSVASDVETDGRHSCQPARSLSHQRSSPRTRLRAAKYGEISRRRISKSQATARSSDPSVALYAAARR